MTTPTPPTSLVVAVLTYQRPDDLPELLPLLAAQANELRLQTKVLVVDNDAGASARPAVEALGLPEVHYVVEPQPGIAAARNRALDEAKQADLLVFIDDDERPESRWLQHLLTTYEETQRPAAVAGAVVPHVGRIDDPWLTAGGFFTRQRHRSGSEQSAASTANLLLDLRQLGGIRFDERFSQTGGSDTMFTRTLVQRGGRIVWCDEAVVVDHIRNVRLSRAWVLQRHFRAGATNSRVAVALARPMARLATRVEWTARGMARITLGGLRTGLGTLARNLGHQARGSRTLARGVGMVAGAWGIRYVEYRRGAKRNL
ncbi:MAG: glycosyltransferase [Nocardioidaceae bacterium]